MARMRYAIAILLLAQPAHADDDDLIAPGISDEASVGVTASARWHVARSDAAETELGLDATVTWFSTVQRATAFRGRDGSTVTAAQVTTFCASHACPAAEQAVIDGLTAKLVQARFAA